jgi:hypothetical protein
VTCETWGQQHLKDAKEGLLEKEGAVIGEKWRMLHTTELLVSKESKDEHANGERASKRSLVLRRGGRRQWLLLQTMTRLITSQLTQQQQFYSISLLEKSNIKISPPLMASPRLHGVHATHAVHGVHCPTHTLSTSVDTCPVSSVHPCTPNPI